MLGLSIRDASPRGKNFRFAGFSHVSLICGGILIAGAEGNAAATIKAEFGNEKAVCMILAAMMVLADVAEMEKVKHEGNGRVEGDFLAFGFPGSEAESYFGKLCAL